MSVPVCMDQGTYLSELDVVSYQTVKVQRRTPLNCYVTCKNSMREYKYISKAIGKYQFIAVNRNISTQRY